MFFPGFAFLGFFIFGLTKVPFGDYFLFFLGFLSKSKFTSTRTPFQVCLLLGF